MTLPRSFRFQAAVFAVTCTVLAAPPLVNEFKVPHPLPCPLFPADRPPTALDMYRLADGGNKDYTLWYEYGRVVAESHRFDGGLPLYISGQGVAYPFMYPPFAAICLAPLSAFGPHAMTVLLVLLNVVGFAVAVELSVRLVDPAGKVPLWVRVVPSGVCLFFINDLFLLGQPNLGLLCLVLGGLTLARSGRGWWAGALFAAATAIKAFPVVVLLYLVWQRYWAATASMLLFLVLFLVVLPIPVRGHDRNLSDLKAWADGMLLAQADQGVGQRPERSVGWRNQSLFGVGSRLLTAGNAKTEEAMTRPGEALYVNVLDLGTGTAKLATVGIGGLLGLGFVAVIPRRAARTRRTDAIEFALLVTLMTVATPYSYGYYFSWLITPLTVLVHHGMTAAERRERVVAWGSVVGVAVLFLASAPQLWGVGPLAIGALFWAAVVALVGLGYLLVRERYR